ncbi:MAG: hypothetical protein AB1485_04050 [Candidatus Thermoplasmatota archaeon]
MDQAKYEWIKKVRKLRDELKAKRKSGPNSILARKIVLWNKRMNLKKRGAGKKFDLRKLSRIKREHGRWNKKSLRWIARGAKFTGKWAIRAARFNARMAKAF